MFVLGVESVQLTNEDLDNIKTPGTYWAINVDSVQNKPSGTNMYNWIMTVKRQGDNIRVIQNFQSVNMKSTYIRYYDGDWKPWQKVSTDIPEFYKSYANESALASALGGLITTADTGDLNNYTTTSISIIYNLQQLNKPADVTGGVLLTFVANASIALQILANYGGGIIYYRVKWSGNWQEWAKLSANVII